MAPRPTVSALFATLALLFGPSRGAAGHPSDAAARLATIIDEYERWVDDQYPEQAITRRRPTAADRITDASIRGYGMRTEHLKIVREDLQAIDPSQLPPADRIDRAGGHMDAPATLAATRIAAGRRIAEPRLLASAAGVVRPAAGRIDLASAEVLTATVSLRTAGLSGRTARQEAGAGWRDRLRGTVQWQADAGRLERWLVAPATCDRWPAAGRAWGTMAFVDGADEIGRAHV
jgi:hypothetical protein